MTRAPAYLLGSGISSCLGNEMAPHLAALRAGTPGPSRRPEGHNIPPFPYHLAGELAGDRRPFELMDAAIRPALAQARLDEGQRRRMAIFVGSTCLDMPGHEAIHAAAVERGTSAVPVLQPAFGNLAAWVALQFGIEGPQYTLNTACSSSANALLHAQWMLDDSRIDHALVIGMESYNRVSVAGFGSLLLLSRKGYRPFDQSRDGLVLGEGAGVVVLGRAPVAGAPRLLGGATACDTSSPTNSTPERVADVMKAALDDTGLTLTDLCAIKAHGTGTPSNDASEGLGMQKLGAALPPFTSLKPYTGHTLGGCGTLETQLLLAAWAEGFLPATPGFATPDPDVGLSPVTSATPLPERGAVLCNFFGFGGNNTSLVVAR